MTDEVDEFVDSHLNIEADQETALENETGSYFAEAPDDQTIISRAREYDDVPKHWVRREVWLKTVKRIKTDKGSGIKILTLPGRHGFEVKLYDREGLIEKRTRPESGETFAVVGFETEPTIFGLLKTGDLKFLEMLRGDVLAALAEPGSPNGKALRAHAPYDVINLDLTANIASKNDGPYSPFLKGVRECFQLQGSHVGPWAMMVTFRSGVKDTDKSVVDSLEKLFQENIDTHLKMGEACFDRYGVRTARELLASNPEEGLGQITAKWIVEQGHAFEWRCRFYKHAAYQRVFQKDRTDQRYSLRKLVFEFERKTTSRGTLVVKAVPPQSWHADDLARLFEQSAILDVDTAISKIDADYLARLEAEIESYR